MQETAQQYIARIRSYLGDKDILSTLSETPAKLQKLLSSVPDRELRARPKPDKWSAMEQLAHLSDVEIVVGFRVRFILGADDGIPVVAFDQDRWLDVLRYNERELAPTFEALRVARENNLRLYRSLSDAQWNKYGQHVERGKETVRDIVAMQAGHDLNHLRQIEAILASKGVGASH
jgi:DinB superfamily